MKIFLFRNIILKRLDKKSPHAEHAGTSHHFWSTGPESALHQFRPKGKLSNAVYVNSIVIVKITENRRALNSARASQYPLGLGGAAERSTMDRALFLRNTAASSSQICDQCCAEAKIETEYRPGTGRFSVRVCLKCGWRDDLSYLMEEPEIPAGPGAYTLDSTRAYLKERFGAMEQPLDLITALQPIANVSLYQNWQRHYKNAFALVEEGFLVQDGTTGATSTPTYRLAKVCHSSAVREGGK